METTIFSDPNAEMPVTNEFVISHTAGEFLVRTQLDIESAITKIEDKWDLNVIAWGPATDEDVEINQRQWTELDTDI